MVISTQQLKNVIREALAEQNEAGIQPIVIPPLVNKPNKNDSLVVTENVLDSLIRHKRYKRVKDGTIETYNKNLYRFARKFPVLPLETDTILEYLDQFKGETGRHKRNQHDWLNMLYKHASRFFGILENPFENLERPGVTLSQIQTLSLTEAFRVNTVVNTIIETVVWEMTCGHGWRQIEVRRIMAGDVRSIKDGIIWCRGKEREEYTPLLPETQELLEKLAEGLSDNEPVIRSRRIRAGKTQPLGENGIRKLIQQLFSRCDIKYQGHDLRRTFCTMVREASGDEFLAMRLARDIIPGVNDRYINARPVQLRESLKKYSPLRLIKQVQDGESLVETGESRTPRPEETTQDILQA